MNLRKKLSCPASENKIVLFEKVRDDFAVMSFGSFHENCSCRALGTVDTDALLLLLLALSCDAAGQNSSAAENQ